MKQKIPDQYQKAENDFISQLTQGSFNAYTLACLKHQPLLRELLRKYISIINRERVIEEILSNFFKNKIRKEDNFATIWENLLRHCSDHLKSLLSDDEHDSLEKDIMQLNHTFSIITNLSPDVQQILKSFSYLESIHQIAENFKLDIDKKKLFPMIQGAFHELFRALNNTDKASQLLLAFFKKSIDTQYNRERPEMLIYISKRKRK